MEDAVEVLGITGFSGCSTCFVVDIGVSDEELTGRGEEAEVVGKGATLPLFFEQAEPIKSEIHRNQIRTRTRDRDGRAFEVVHPPNC